MREVVSYNNRYGRRGGPLLIALLAVIVLAAACGDDGDSTSDEPGEQQDDGANATVNACPDDGCTISIADAALDDEEVTITWEANFAPDVARNHIHVYWDTYTAGEVSGDAEANGLEQGNWVPTDADPVFRTEGAVSIAERGDSTTVCVTAADRDHNVLNVDLVDCRDVSDLLAA